MPNKQYIKGRNKEYKIIKSLKKDGCDIVQRTAGSHSPIDIIAINKQTKVISFIQSKPDALPISMIRKLYADNSWLNGLWCVTFEVR